MTRRRTALVGREPELARLDGFLQRAFVGGEALVVAGDPGVGKTSLLRYVVDRCVHHDAVVLQGSGTEVEIETGFAALHQLLYPYRERLEQLDSRHRVTLGVCLGLVDGPPPQRSAVGAASVALISQLAREHPVLVAVDDVQWVDRPSADVLAVVASHVAGQRVALLATVRDGTRSFFDHGTLPHLWVGPLNGSDSAALLEQREPMLPRATRDWILAQATGNPLAILELPLDAVATSWTVAPALSTRLQGLFAPRIQQLPRSARTFLLCMALEASGDLGVVLAAAARQATEADARLCAQRGLVTLDRVGATVQATHPLVRSTVVGLASWSERREAHRALAAANAGSLVRRAQHLAAAAVGRDEAVAGLLEESAEELLRRGDGAGAVAALLRSAELSREPRKRGRRLAQAAYVGAEVTGDLGGVSSLLAQARRDVPPAEQSLATATAAAYLLLNGDGDVRTSHRLLVAALQGRGDGEVSDSVRVEAVFTLLWICFFAGHSELWKPFHAELARLGPRAPQSLRLCAATFATPVVTGASARPELHEAIAAFEVQADPAQVVLVARAAFYLDELNACRTALWRAAEGDDEGETVTLAIAAWMLLGFEAYLDGQWDEAVRYCERGLELTQRHGFELLSWPGRYGLALVAAARGKDDVAASFTDEMLQWAQPRGVLSVMAYAHHAAAVSALGHRDFETAYRHASQVSAPGVIEPGLAHALWLMMDLVDAAVHSNRQAEALAHVEAMRAARVEQLSSRYALILAGCEALVAGPDRTHEAFQRALGTKEVDRWPFELARIQLAYGEQLRRARLHTRARDQLVAALEGFTLLRAEPWAARARSELAAGTSRHASVGAVVELTTRELEVATLAATGLTNTQIGARLGASPRTVAAHLSRVLAKLQLTSRAGLRDALRGTAVSG
ncbi:MAG: hypothetical protein AVDCRST_MAG34-1772 [uncultured Nocardioidaceae bacterium]|uniref:HTH luxR-type domain-containing protein n=1 Tax=uncultured Nocardioidaceae bacterium TaxID=253824 RepID=A0A6J4M6C9_9ACTN|nr:MAG: hypothetical protein AVDCRST_MAG34-1772 [uncultured Nocardioidaceae bacterium]